jgi:Diadenosine tetraphosphatase and related serine/threonine protein phosphatases
MKHYKDEAIFKLALEVAYEIPLGIILEGKTLVMHAGISGPTLTIADLNRIPKGIDTTENELLDEIVWSDPQDQNGILDVPTRGRMFGPDISKAFLDLNRLDRIIRGHDNVKNGYMVHHQGRVITVWSAPTYRGRRGSYVNVNVTGELDVHYFETPNVTIVEQERK